jgi:hypothetical protein
VAQVLLYQPFPDCENRKEFAFSTLDLSMDFNTSFPFIQQFNLGFARDPRNNEISQVNRAR